VVPRELEKRSGVDDRPGKGFSNDRVFDCRSLALGAAVKKAILPVLKAPETDTSSHSP
jgi:hypothetical protein